MNLRENARQNDVLLIPERLLFVIAFAIYCLATWLRFRGWEPSVFYADDLFNYLLYHGDRYNSPWATIFFADGSQKFRFVFSSAMRAEIFLFGTHISGYLAVNLAVHAASGALLCIMAYRSCRSWLISVVMGAIAVTSRFGLYQVTQATGQVESLSLLFCLLCVLCVSKAGDFEASREPTWSPRWKWAALIFAFLAFNAHERYLVLLPWLAIFFIFHRRAGSIRQRAVFAALCAAVVVSNALVKLYVFHSAFFRGTGGQPLKIVPRSILDLLSQSTLSIFGLNHGPEYLIGAEWSDFSVTVRVASIVSLLISLFLVGAALIGKKSSRLGAARLWPVSLIALIVLLLLPALLTIRMEQRWELGPFFLLLLVLATGVARFLDSNSGQRVVGVMLLCMIVSTVVIETRVSQSFSSIFFVYAGRFAESVQHEVVDSGTSPHGTPVVFVTGTGNCIGTLMDGGFFIVYEGQYRKVQCVKAMGDAPPTSFPANTRMFTETDPGVLDDVTNEWRPRP